MSRPAHSNPMKRLAPALLWMGLAGLLAGNAWAQKASTPEGKAQTTPNGKAVTIALIELDEDPRYEPRRLEKRYPGHPWGRLHAAMQLGADDSAVALRSTGRTFNLRTVTLGHLEELDSALQKLKADKVTYWVLDLPATGVAQAAKTAGNSALLFNASAPQDPLRGTQCAGTLFHTFPSQAMLQDALAQYLAAWNWRNAWVLQGPQPEDAALGAAWARAAKRYGVKTVGNKAFKLSGDPRERDLANTRLLTADRQHDVVAVLDSDGEFARTLPYATQQPRPVVGSNGLVPQAWHPQWERNGGPQVSRRFRREAARPMTGQDWAAWMAVRTVTALLVDHPPTDPTGQAQLLRSGKVFVDGAKGPRLSYRSWDGQLRQPVFLAHVDGVVGVAPLDGVLHPTDTLDTLGVDQKESTCKATP